ncbi:transposase (plasmid) [Streptomyces sp. NBC_01340]|uniref:transposase n=1 Tax=unclassified Streptomyces TaxID=2593676 RepID=UPI002B1CBCD8|nr:MULTISPECIES: transposase [unclassified Streptomyces]WSI45944.1 transposase [Streptomyces sp. NBC_01340]
MKHYPPEFKADVVALYESQPEATIKRIAADLGVNPETLRHWIRDAGTSRPRSRRTAKPPAVAVVPLALEAEVAALRRENAELKKEREILRKAARWPRRRAGEPLPEALHHIRDVMFAEDAFSCEPASPPAPWRPGATSRSASSASPSPPASGTTPATPDDRSPSSDSHVHETDVTRLLQFEVRAKVARRRGGSVDSLELYLAGSPTAT